MVEAPNESHSSDDELINLDFEVENDEDGVLPVERYKDSYNYTKVSDSSDSEPENDDIESISNAESGSEDNIFDANIDFPIKVKEEDSKFIVIGNDDVGPTCTPIDFKDSWIKNAKQFPAAIHKKNNLSELDSISELCPILRDEVRKYTDSWFPVQKAVLPILVKYEKAILPPRDLVITAPTGSGKTLCFVLPILNALRYVTEENEPTTKVFALIIVPVQNLAQQIFQEFEKFNVFHSKIELFNASENKNDEKPQNFAHIIISTPGRFIESLVNPLTKLDLSNLRYLVIDEADRLQDTARIEWLNIVERRARASRTNNLTITDLTNPFQNRWLQKILVSATLSLDIEHLQTWNLRCPLLFKATAHESEQINSNLLTLPTNLKHNVILCDLKMKPLLVYTNLIANMDWKKILVFANKRDTCHRLTRLLNYLSKKSFVVAELSANLYEKRRQNILNKFQNEEIRVLICSDIMSRGIDINDIDCVINYDPPINERIFIHRAGRTARALSKGIVLSFLTKEEKMLMKKMLDKMNLWTENIDDQRRNEKILTQKTLKNYEKALKNLKEKMEK